MIVRITTMTSEADMDAKAYVHWKSWQETYDGIVDASFLETLTLEKFRERARRWPDNTLLAKTEDGETIGFAAYGESRDEDSEHCGEIFAIYVLQAYQKQQVGFALMNACVERLREYDKIAVWVFEKNDTALRFYERYGFVRDGVEQEIVCGKPLVGVRLIYDRRRQVAERGV